MHHLPMLIKLISHMSNPKSLLESAHVELACLIKPMVRVDVAIITVRTFLKG